MDNNREKILSFSSSSSHKYMIMYHKWMSFICHGYHPWLFSVLEIYSTHTIKHIYSTIYIYIYILCIIIIIMWHAIPKPALYLNIY